MKLIKLPFFALAFSLSISNISKAELNYRCEHQGSQNAMQFPIENYFYVTIAKPKSFSSYSVLFVNKNKVTQSLKYQSGVTTFADAENKKIITTNWNGFNAKFELLKKELSPLLSLGERELNLIPQLNIDFLSKINEANIYHSQVLASETISDRKNNEAIFNLTGPLLDIEKTTSLPGNKVNHQIANKNITYNDKTGMLLQVEIKINSAFLRHVFACKTWEANKIDLKLNTDGFKKIDGADLQYELNETDYDNHYGYFSKAIMDVLFRASANYYKENPDLEMPVETKTKMIHALIKSKAWDSFIRKELSLKNKDEIQNRIKYLVFVYSQKYLTREFGGLDAKTLAKIYQDMFVIIGSYHELIIKGYK